MICDSCFGYFLATELEEFLYLEIQNALQYYELKLGFPFLQKHTHSLKPALAKAVTNTKKYCPCLKSLSANLKGGDMSQFAMAFLLLE